MPKKNACAARVAAMTDDEFTELAAAVDERRCRDEYGFGTYAEAAALYRPDPACPSCGAAEPSRDGWSESGLQRYRCESCGTRFNSLTGTVLEHCRKELATWVGFVNLMRFNVPLDAAAETCRVTHQTAWEWRHRIFAAVDGCQERIVLKDRVWIDETYVNDTDLAHGYGEARKRGLSKQKLCIAVAIDVHKNPVAVVCGHGKPSAKRIRDGLQSHIAEGSTIVGDKEKSHDSLVRAVKGTHEAYRADVGDPVYLERMSLVNNLCSWLKRYLWRFTGMDPKNLQSYLNWYVYLFRVNQARDRWPETERVVRHLLMTDARFHSST
ncbi:IS1595 family transposase [Olsenella sp. oral taxon 807]|uniref:IS1595 family transposase n=1 Tax=Olsenella sp. oral taxon 807 TaxID=712411 RepID=UPI00067C8C27|nr:IS1595 family transposase [Olsenella sp. oral taxon 807]